MEGNQQMIPEIIMTVEIASKRRVFAPALITLECHMLVYLIGLHIYDIKI